MAGQKLPLPDLGNPDDGKLGKVVFYPITSPKDSERYIAGVIKLCEEIVTLYIAQLRKLANQRAGVDTAVESSAEAEPLQDEINGAEILEDIDFTVNSVRTPMRDISLPGVRLVRVAVEGDYAEEIICGLEIIVFGEHNTRTIFTFRLDPQIAKAIASYAPEGWNGEYNTANNNLDQQIIIKPNQQPIQIVLIQKDDSKIVAQVTCEQPGRVTATSISGWKFHIKFVTIPTS